jgi:cytochrome P450
MPDHSIPSRRGPRRRSALASEVKRHPVVKNGGMHPTHPDHPIHAVSHRDPYPYYASLLTRPALFHDPRLGAWIAARAATVAEVFDNPACRVRPATEPIPLALLGSSAGEVFRQLVRMNDGVTHALGKGVLQRALADLPADRIRASTRAIVSQALPQADMPTDLNAWVFNTPVSVVADLLGSVPSGIPAIVTSVRDFVRCLSPSSDGAQLVKASLAASALQYALGSQRHGSLADHSLMNRVCREARIASWTDDAALLANMVGLLSQTYEATAGLLGNSIVALASHAGLLQQVRDHPDGWRQLVRETSRHDASVQNTRRFVATPTRIAGVAVDAGAVIVLLLAAANRDPQANEQPGQFLLHRPTRCTFSFSRGAHACPGQDLATEIVSTALACLFKTWSEKEVAGLAWTYHSSANARLPMFSLAKPT